MSFRLLGAPAALALVCVAPLAAMSTNAQAQATVVNDGRVRAALGLGASRSSGNSRASNLSLTGETVRATDADKVSLNGSAQYARSQGAVTGQRARLAARYDRNLRPRLFGFGGLALEHDRFTNLQLRQQIEGGLGLHLVRSERSTWDVFGGLGYAHDRFIDPMPVDGVLRRSDGYATLLLAEESTHKLSASTNFKQRLALTPALGRDGEYRATFDTGLAVAMTSTINLTVGLNVSHHSDPGPGRQTTDSLLTTGIAMKFE